MEPTGEVWLYFDYARKLASGLMPGFDFQADYPGGALAIFSFVNYLSRWFPFHFAFHLLVLVAIIILLKTIWRFNKVAALVSLSALAILQASDYKFVFERYDIFVALLTFFAVTYQAMGKWYNSFVGLGIAIGTKIYPIILLPLFRVKKPLHVVSIVLISAVLLFYGFGPKGFFKYHANRGIEIEAVYNLALFWQKPQVVYEAASYTFKYPSWFTLPITGLLLILSYYGQKRFNLWQNAFTTILAFLIGSKLLSPQFLIWLMPFVGFMDTKTIWLFLIATGITSWYFTYWGQITQLQTPYFYAVLVRNAILLFIFIRLIYIRFKGVR